MTRFPGLGFGSQRFKLFLEGGNLLLVFNQRIDAAGGGAHAGLHHIFGELFFIKENYFFHIAHTSLQILAKSHDLANDDGRAGERLQHAKLPALNALGDFNLALTGEQGYGAHLAEIHANGVIRFFPRYRG